MLILVSCAEALSVINGVNDTLIEIVVVGVAILLADTLEVELDDSILVFVILVIPEDVIVDTTDGVTVDITVGVYVDIGVVVTDPVIVLIALLLGVGQLDGLGVANWLTDTLEVELADSTLVFVILIIPEDVTVDANDPDLLDVTVCVFVSNAVGVIDTDLVLLTLLVTEIVEECVDVRVFVLLVVGQVDEVDVLLFVVVADCELDTVGVLVLVLLDVPVIISVIVLDTVLVYELSVDALAIFVVDTDGEDVILDVILLDPVSDVVIVSV